MYRNSRRLYGTLLLSVLATVLTVETSAQAQNSVGAGQPRPAISVLDSTKEQDGLVGAVRRVKIESAKVEVKDGRPVEGPRQLLELTTYGFNGNRVENTSYPGGDSLIGKEEYKYDNRGNIIEMTLRDDRGAILSREAYSYEFDTFGNWTKMVTSLVVFENGQLKREPVEVTYRTVTYYFNESIAKIVNVSSPQKMPKAPEPTEFKPLSLEKDGINLSFSASREVSSSSLEEVGTPPPFPTKPPPTEKTVANGKKGSDETSRGAGPIQNAREAIELKHDESESTPVAAGNSSAVESSRTEGSPVNFKPAASADAKKAAVESYRSALALFRAGDVKASIEAYLQSIELDPETAEVFLSLGTAYVKLEKNNDAAKAFRQAVKLNPDLAEAQYGLALTYFRLRRFREAVVAFKKATKLDPKMAKAHFGLGMAYQELGETNFVMEQYRILESLDKDLANRFAKNSRYPLRMRD
jgi:Flp pilus assembly protein TadD